jgi:hypothetical protein
MLIDALKCMTMKKDSRLYYYLIILFVTGSMLVACDTEGEESMSWRPGNSLHIVGPDEIEAGSEESYYVDGFTIKETYTWQLDGAPITPTRNGEFVALEFEDEGEHTLTVTNGKYTGTLNVTVVEE